MGGNLKICELLINRFNYTVDDVRSNENQALIGACNSKNLRIVLLLIKTFKNAFKNIGVRGEEAIKYICNNKVNGRKIKIKACRKLLNVLNFTEDNIKNVLEHIYLLSGRLFNELINKFNLNEEYSKKAWNTIALKFEN